MANLTSGSLILRNTIFNLIGQVAPSLVAIISIPVLINHLGTDRFGVLTLAWILIGYFSIFDLGLSRALAQLVSEVLGTSEEENLPKYIWTALLLMFLFGLLGVVIVSLLSPFLVYNLFKIPDSLKVETLRSFYLLAISLPVVISTAGLRGVLEALQRFDLINVIRVPMGLFTFIGPLLVLPFSNDLALVVAILVVGRCIAWAIHLLFCIRVMPGLRKISLYPTIIGRLLRFGGWLTVSSIVGPLMVYLDRFLIGSAVSITNVAYYSTPYDLITKLSLFSSALVGVLFPAFTTSFVQNRNRTIFLFDQGVKYVFLLLFPITLVVTIFAREGLTLWLGKEFADNGAVVLQILAIGVFINNLALLPFTLIQSVGRPDIAAKLHLIELPLYLFGLWWLVSSYGIEGAAIAWLIRAVIDSLVMFGIAQRLIIIDRETMNRMVLMIGSSILVLAISMIIWGLLIKIIFAVVALAIFAIITWFILLGPDERAMMTDIKSLRASLVPVKPTNHVGSSIL